MPQKRQPDESTKAYAQRRLFEIIPGAVTWLTILLIVPISIWAPVWAAFLVILYDLTWLIKVAHISTHLVFSYREVRMTERRNYLEILKQMEDVPGFIQHLEEKKRNLRGKMREKRYSFARIPLKTRLREVEWQLEEVTNTLPFADKIPSWRDIYHVVVIPTVKEPFGVLQDTLDALENSDYPNDRIIVVMAFEERARELGETNLAKVQEHYGNTFFMLRSYFHPSDIPGEIKAKSANCTYAMRQFASEVERLSIPEENILVSNFDSDTQVSPEYFGCLTFHYLKHPQRTRASYQPIPVYHNNLWDVPAMGRVAALGSTFWQMIEASRPQRLITFSSHAMSYKALVEVDYWPVDVISEDSQIFWRAYLHYGGKYEVEPMFTTVSMDATAGDTYYKAHKAQYIQKQRWFWGVENFPYISLGFMKHKEIPLRHRIAHWFRMLDSFYTLTTAPIILAVGGWLPVVLGGDAFQQNVVSQNMVILTQVLTTLALVGLLTTFIISMTIIPAKPEKVLRHRNISMFTQWLLVPIVTFVFGSVPAIDSQTRLMTGRYIGEFWVADKDREAKRKRQNT